MAAEAIRPGAMNSLYGMPLMWATYVPSPKPSASRYRNGSRKVGRSAPRHSFEKTRAFRSQTAPASRGTGTISRSGIRGPRPE